MIGHSDTGSGSPPLVLVHAFGCGRSDWDAQVAHFSPSHRVIAVDLGGHGETPARPGHERVETHGADVAALMLALDLPPAVVVGNSLGCRVALEVAARAPDRTRAIVLVDGSRLGAPGRPANAALGGGLDPGAYRDFVGPMFASMFSPGFDPQAVAHMTARAAALEPRFAVALLADVGRHDAERMDSLLAALAAPVLAVQSTRIAEDGRRHRLSAGDTSPYLDMLRERIAGLSVAIVPDAGHYPQIEQPSATNAAIARFLASL